MPPIRLLIADDHPVVRTGLRGMFVQQEAFDVLGEATDGAEALRMTLALKPDVVLMDLRMPGMDGLAAMQAIHAARPETRVLILSTFSAAHEVMTAIQAGAAGYVLKDASREELFQAVRAAAQGRTTLSAALSAQIIDTLRAPEDALTEREIEVLRLAAQGETNKGIGRVLHISEATVKTHLKHIYAKMGVSDRAAAVALALEQGILRLGR